MEIFIFLFLAILTVRVFLSVCLALWAVSIWTFLNSETFLDYFIFSPLNFYLRTLIVLIIMLFLFLSSLNFIFSISSSFSHKKMQYPGIPQLHFPTHKYVPQLLLIFIPNEFNSLFQILIFFFNVRDYVGFFFMTLYVKNYFFLFIHLLFFFFFFTDL